MHPAITSQKQFKTIVIITEIRYTLYKMLQILLVLSHYLIEIEISSRQSKLYIQYDDAIPFFFFFFFLKFCTILKHRGWMKMKCIRSLEKLYFGPNCVLSSIFGSLSWICLKFYRKCFFFQSWKILVSWKQSWKTLQSNFGHTCQQFCDLWNRLHPFLHTTIFFSSLSLDIFDILKKAYF